MNKLPSFVIKHRGIPLHLNNTFTCKFEKISNQLFSPYSVCNLKTHEHGCPEVELVEELRDEDVHLQHVRHVLAFDVTQNVDEPLEVTV